MARKKRNNGEGSLFYSDSLQTWVGDIVLPDGTTKRKKNKLQRVVREWLEEQKESVRKGGWVSTNSITYGEFFDRYMAEVAKHTLRSTTYQSYNYCIGKNVLPKIGSVRLSVLRTEHIQRLYSDLLGEGLSKNTIKYIHAVIRKSL